MLRVLPKPHQQDLPCGGSLSLEDERALNVLGSTDVHPTCISMKTPTSLKVFTLGDTSTRYAHTSKEYFPFYVGVI